MKTAVERAGIGALGGCLATLPMTFFMEWMHGRLPADEQYPLPPREITDVATEQAGIAPQMDEQQHEALTTLAHFGMGTAAGTLYGVVAPLVPGPPLVKGITYGLAVWAGNYLGILPALGVLAPATEHPTERTQLMILAHVIWGAALGVTTDALLGVMGNADDAGVATR